MVSRRDHMTDFKVKDFIFGMPTRFAAEKANGLEATIQFVISGKDGGNFVLRINCLLYTSAAADE